MCSQRCCETLKAQLICQAQGNVLSADRAAVGDLAFKAYRDEEQTTPPGTGAARGGPSLLSLCPILNGSRMD